jgi:uncharacterized damage-inducible protein DinB
VKTGAPDSVNLLRARLPRRFNVPVTGQWNPFGGPMGRPARPQGERDVVLDRLEEQRAGLVAACEGLTPEQLATRAVPPSQVSLLGLVRHLAAVEHHWFRRVLGERLDLPHLWPDDSDRGFADVVATPDAVAAAWEHWHGEVAHARALTGDLPAEAFGIEIDRGRSGTIAVRDLVVHVVEEYARHLGHADLLRERLDGRTNR